MRAKEGGRGRKVEGVRERLRQGGRKREGVREGGKKGRGRREGGIGEMDQDVTKAQILESIRRAKAVK